MYPLRTSHRLWAIAPRFAAMLLVFATVIAVSFAGVAPAEAQSLRAASASLDRQNREARGHDFTYLRNSAQLQRFLDSSLLVTVSGNEDYSLKDVSFPVARPAVKLFIERLSAQYRRACGERLVVTSLTRPLANQPSNASSRSVHPTGMALDLRRPYPGPCRDWLEDTLLYLEGRKVLEATREYRPSHYHIALFPQQYVSHVSRATGRSEASIAASLAQETTYRVRTQDTLWQISRRYGITPEAIQQANGLRSSTIYPGQLLKIPSAVDQR